MSSAEVPHAETVDPLILESPDSSTSPTVDKSSVKKEEKVQVKKQKSRTVFSATQLCVLNARFQRQKYLSL
ncbi:Homeobox protein NANOG [Tupaia chinensis]|uniref:Homeobox protein NANOG n=1 Tax=Tupaia chinensis TaxID=246437 RepID=L9KXT4_TUPCH|nr:Homeobox protein NANOG [Tupaia chinensis]